MNITLFGGSFNPPHFGHLIVIEQAFVIIENIDQLWLLPDYNHSFEKGNRFAPVNDRLQMTKLLENHIAKSLDNKKIRTETCTIDQKMSGNTIQHITYLNKLHPRHKFSFLMGSDNLSSFHKWPKYKTLLKLMPFYIYPRAGKPMMPLRDHMQPMEHPLQVITNISSTLVRNRIKQNLPITHLVPKSVLQYLRVKHVYDKK